LICVKIEKGGKVLVIRGDWAIPKVTTGKEKPNSEKPKPGGGRGGMGGMKGKDSVNQTVISVEPKGEKEFVVLTMTKSLSFIAEDSALRLNWVSNIQRALDTTTASSTAA